MLVTPSFSKNVIGATNLTGHPCVVVPNGFVDKGTPSSISFIGGLDQDSDALLVAHWYQRHSEHHLRRPDLDALPVLETR